MLKNTKIAKAALAFIAAERAWMESGFEEEVATARKRLSAARRELYEACGFPAPPRRVIAEKKDA